MTRENYHHTCRHESGRQQGLPTAGLPFSILHFIPVPESGLVHSGQMRLMTPKWFNL